TCAIPSLWVTIVQNPESEVPFMALLRLRQQQPALALHHLPRCAPFAKELCPAYFLHCCSRMLHDVELVIHDPALRQPLLDALPERLPHIHTASSDRIALEAAQLLPEELVQRFFLPFPPEPQRLSGLQVAHHGEELLFLPQMNLVKAHLPQGRLSSRLRPALQIAKIDGSPRAGRQPKLLRPPPHRAALSQA